MTPDALILTSYVLDAAVVVVEYALARRRGERPDRLTSAFAAFFLLVFLSCGFLAYPGEGAHGGPQGWAHAAIAWAFTAFAWRSRVFRSLFSARDTLRAAEARARALAQAHGSEAALALRALDALSVIVFAIDRESVVRLSVGDGLRPLGLEPGQLVGARVEAVRERGNASPDAVGEDEAAVIRRVARTGRPETHRNLHRGPGGREVWRRTEYVPDPATPPGERPEFVFGCGVDVTEEEEARRTARAEARQLRQFVGEDFDTWAETRARDLPPTRPQPGHGP